MIERRAFLLAVLVSPLACTRGASASEPDRCAFCGMRIAPGSHWSSGATDTAGHAFVFDTPGCLFRYRTTAGHRPLATAWVTEYYGAAGTHTDARTVRYVTGSDVIGPMGADLVPVSAARVDAFVRDHHGRATLDFDHVTADVLQHL